jgi:hypothetical protein
MDSSQCQFWNGRAESPGELFTLTNNRSAIARCALWSHQLGWELRLEVNGSLVRSQVVRTLDEMAAYLEWKSTMLTDGWRSIATVDNE